MSDEPKITGVTKVSPFIPVLSDEHGTPYCPDPGCGELMVEINPGSWMCPVTRDTTKAMMEIARAVMEAEGL